MTCPLLSMLMRVSPIDTAESPTEWNVGWMLICITSKMYCLGRHIKGLLCMKSSWSCTCVNAPAQLLWTLGKPLKSLASCEARRSLTSVGPIDTPVGVTELPMGAT